MKIFIQFALLGLGAGGLYALSGIGLVLVHRGSGVINFAHGAIGMVGTYVYWWLATTAHLPVAGAVIAGSGASATLGGLTHILVMRPLRTAAVLTRIVATLGVLIAL